MTNLPDPKSAEQRSSPSLDFVTAYASEVVYHGDQFVRQNRGTILKLIEANRKAATTASVEEIALTLTRQATLVERIISNYSVRAVEETDPMASAALAKTALSAVRTLIQLKSAQLTLIREGHHADHS